MKRQRLLLRREAARVFMWRVRRETVCVQCGRQPVDFHSDAHLTQPRSRISNLVSRGATIGRIMRELQRCMPLCRRCHVALDGRMERIRAARRSAQAGAT
jgi:hypothetical protein